MKTKVPAIKELCKSCNARAYLIVSPKDNFDCLMNLGQKVLETIRNKNYSVKPEHLLRQAYCENHKSRKKQWVIDLDSDEMTEYLYNKDNDFPEGSKEWKANDVYSLIQDMLKECGKDPNEAYIVPTRNGCHIITPPFNLIAAQKKCNMLFEGRKKVPYKIDYVAPYVEEVKHKEVTGWLHKDGMTLMYAIINESGNH